MVKKDMKNCNYPHGAIIIWDLLNPQKSNGNSKIEYSIFYVVLKAKKSTVKYKLENNFVIYYIFEGKGLIYINGEEEKIYPVQVIVIPPDSPHHIENTANIELKYMRIVYPI